MLAASREITDAGGDAAIDRLARLMQEDDDADGMGDACDSDADGDSWVAGYDNCPLKENAGQEDGDSDGPGDVCDTCANDPLNDVDSDGVCGDVDNCPSTSNPGQEDQDRVEAALAQERGPALSSRPARSSRGSWTAAST